ncbi:cupredoxin domain-containing protein [Streptomyces sp. 8N616]|uniref:cupredoxin domain-containing protein n=1 Tax=Streptomyces sp. 8N616 TaxID=3457414 RepID=UPI003FD21E76
MTGTRTALRAVRAAAALLLLAIGLTPLTAGQASAVGRQVVMQGYAYGPAALTIAAGTTVTWTNKDTAPHDVKTRSGPVAIHSPLLDKGESWSFTFTTPGTYSYYCTVHPDMTAGIVVKPAAAPATTAAPQHDAGHDHDHSGGTPPRASASRPATTATGTAGRAPSRAPSASSPAIRTAGSSPPAPAPSAAASTSAVPAAAPAGTARPLDPLLALAGLVAGIAVLCLLLVGSRAAGR